jgi:hypothetical protein
VITPLSSSSSSSQFLGFLAESAEEYSEAMCAALSLSAEDAHDMRVRARHAAETRFDPLTFRTALDTLLPALGIPVT